MSKTRQAATERIPHVRTAAVGFSPGYRWRTAANRWGELLNTSRGTLSVETGDGVWVVPPTQALWVPPGYAKAVSLSGHGALRRVYLRGEPCQRMPATVRAIQVSPLLRELLRRTMERGTLDRRRVRERRFVDVLVDELRMARPGSIELPMPRDARAVRAAALVRHDPSATRDVDVVARNAGASVRTLERLFKSETGLAFGAWRQRARLLHSLVLLADGDSVSRAALAVGYSSASAYVAAFKGLFGSTPRTHRAVP